MLATAEISRMNQLVVVHSVFPCCCADADDPQLTEFALSDPSIPIGVAQRLFNGLFGELVELALIEVIAFRKP